ncbi:MAG: triose-phosphate isomerase [Patescibacteria group bacterium]
MKKTKSKKKSFSPYVVANWKMNLMYQETENLIIALREKLKNFYAKCHIVICPSYTVLDRARQLLIASKIELGAQDMFWELSGNYTSQISVKMLRELNCHYVMIGHSERKIYAGETDETIDRKTVVAVRNGIIPIICVGETREQRRQGVQFMVVNDQVKKALRFVNPIFSQERIIICYEPVWSIYPGQPCIPAQAREMAMVIRQALIDLYPEDIVYNNFELIYGGSVEEKNVLNYVDGESFSGVLVGTASLEVEKFSKIIKHLCYRHKPKEIKLKKEIIK